MLNFNINNVSKILQNIAHNDNLCYYKFIYLIIMRIIMSITEPFLRWAGGKKLVC